MQNISTILAVFDESGTATVIAANDAEVHVLVRVRQLGQSGSVIFARLIEALFARPDTKRTLILIGAEPMAPGRTLMLPEGTPVLRLPPWSVIARVIRNAEHEHDGVRRPIPPRL